MSRTELITDHRAVLADLDELWRRGEFRDWQNKPRVRLADSVHDQQPVGDNPLWEVVRNLPLDPHMRAIGNTAHAVEVDGHAYVGRPGLTRYPAGRTALCMTYAWAIPTPGDIAWIVDQLDGRAVVEIGAGTGYWAWQLSQAEVDVLAFDTEPGGNDWCGEVQYHPVHHGGPDQAAEHPARALLLCWPPYGSPMAAEALSIYAGDLVISIGEPEGGCTGDDEFFRLLEKGFDEVGDSPHHVTYSGIHCYVTAYRRKTVQEGQTR